MEGSRLVSSFKSQVVRPLGSGGSMPTPTPHPLPVVSAAKAPRSSSRRSNSSVKGLTYKKIKTKLGLTINTESLTRAQLGAMVRDLKSGTADDIKKQLQAIEEGSDALTSSQLKLVEVYAKFVNPRPSHEKQYTHAALRVLGESVDEVMKDLNSSRLDIDRAKEYLRQNLRSLPKDAQYKTDEQVKGLVKEVLVKKVNDSYVLTARELRLIHRMSAPTNVPVGVDPKLLLEWSQSQWATT